MVTGRGLVAFVGKHKLPPFVPKVLLRFSWLDCGLLAGFPLRRGRVTHKGTKTQRIDGWQVVGVFVRKLFDGQVLFDAGPGRGWLYVAKQTESGGL